MHWQQGRMNPPAIIPSSPLPVMQAAMSHRQATYWAAIIVAMMLHSKQVLSHAPAAKQPTKAA